MIGVNEMALLHALFQFNGRLNRKGFWQGMGCCLLLVLIGTYLFPFQEGFTFTASTILPIALFALILWVFSAVVAKRAHDRGRTGWSVLMLFFPGICYAYGQQLEGVWGWALGAGLPMFILTVVVLDWGVFQGMQEENRFGKKGESISFKKFKD